MILLREGGDLFMELETLVGSEMPAQQLMFFPSGSGQPAGFFLHGMPERGLIEWVLETFISPDSVFIDAGAHIGTYTWTCGQKASTPTPSSALPSHFATWPPMWRCTGWLAK